MSADYTVTPDTIAATETTETTETIWISKSRPDNWLRIPAPADRDNWHEVGVPVGFSPDGLIYDPITGAFAPPTVVQQAEAAADLARRERDTRIRQASEVIAPLADAEAAGWLEENDVPRLEAWRRYRYALTRVEVTATPVVWPQAPE